MVYQGLSTGLEIRLSQLDISHNTLAHQHTTTHMLKHPVTELPVKQSDHEAPEDRGANGEKGGGMLDLKDRCERTEMDAKFSLSQRRQRWKDREAQS